MQSEVENIDCMIGMARYPDKFFDLAVVDPPYGIGAENHAGNKENGWNQWDQKEWDSSVPKKEYFVELFRVSKNQIIWGGNYFTFFLQPSQCWIIWDKGQRDFSLADAELAWTSFKKSIRVFGYARGKSNMENKIHPTQKPITLYSWIYKNYLPNGGKVLDTHLGSGSNRIAADKAGNIDFTGYEIDKDYYEAQEKRFKDYKQQLTMF